MADLHSKIIVKNYTIHEQIGEGGFSKVYRASTSKGKTVAVKLIEDRKSALNEKRCLEKLSKVRGVAGLIDYIELNKKTALVMKILEKTVGEAMFMNTKKRNIRNAVSLAIKGLKIIKNVHERGIIHSDIKPGQFMTNKKKVYLIDFGLGRVFMRRDHHEKQKDINKISGTATYASLNTHKGLSLSRRDDLISFCYTLIDLALGSLPWSNIIEPDSYKRWKIVEGIKTNTPNSVVCKGLPSEFCSLLDYSTQLTYEECPNYDMLIKMFSALRRPKKALLDQNNSLSQLNSETLTKDLKFKSLVEQSDYAVLEKTEECSLPEIIKTLI